MTLIHLARRLLIPLLLTLVAACDSPSLARIPPGGTIVAFGDSLTQGVGTSTPNSYPSVLAELSGITVINSGISGETTDRGLARLPRVLEQHQPDLLILLEGGNDILRSVAFDQVESNLAAMIELAQARAIPVLLVAVPQKSLFSSAAPFYPKLEERYQLLYDGELVASLLRRPAYKSDGVHFNADGYRKLAEGIHAVLQDSGAL